MTEKNTTAIDKKEPSNTAEKLAPTSNKKFNWSALWLVIAIILALLAMAGAAYVWLQLDQYKQQASGNLNKSIATIESKLQTKLESNDVTQQIERLVSPLQAHLARLQKKAQQASQARDSLTESTQKLFELYGRDKNGWQLAEVEYLLRIAQHRLVIENDFQGAAKTLKAADDKISEIADPGLLPVRIAISDERVLLQTRSRPDLVGIVLSLSRMSKQIPLLNLQANKQGDKTKQNLNSFEQDQVDANLPWQDQIVQFVKGLVKVETVTKSLATPSVNLVNAINTLEEKLKLAKWAVLERDQKQYQQLIQQSNELFKQFIDENNVYHREIKEELERLLTQEIRPQLPDISGSLLLLKGIMLKKEQLVSQQKSAPQVLKLETVTTKELPKKPKSLPIKEVTVEKVAVEASSSTEKVITEQPQGTEQQETLGENNE